MAKACLIEDLNSNLIQFDCQFAHQLSDCTAQATLRAPLFPRALVRGSWTIFSDWLTSMKSLVKETWPG